MIFAREVSDSLTSLVKKIDEATGKNKSNKMGSFVVFVGASEGLDKKLTMRPLYTCRRGRYSHPPKVGRN